MFNLPAAGETLSIRPMELMPNTLQLNLSVGPTFCSGFCVYSPMLFVYLLMNKDVCY